MVRKTYPWPDSSFLLAGQGLYVSPERLCQVSWLKKYTCSTLRPSRSVIALAGARKGKNYRGLERSEYCATPGCFEYLLRRLL
jgi:hypothetical protein